MGDINPKLSNGASSVIGSYVDFMSNYILQNEAANRQYNNQLKLWNHTFKEQNARQDWLNMHSVETQKNALRSAGLSAASLNGAPFSGDVSGGSTGSMTGDYARMNLAQNILAAKQLDIQDKVADADVRLKDAEALKASNEAYEVAENASSNRSLQAAQIAYYNGQVGLNSAMRRYYDTLDAQGRQSLIMNVYNFQKGLEEADSRIASNYASADYSHEAAIKAKVDAWHTYRSSDAVISQLRSAAVANMSQAHLNDTKSMEIVEMLVPNMLEKCSQADYYDASTGALNAEKVSRDLQNELTKTYGDTERIIGMITDGIGAVANAVLSVKIGSSIKGGATIVQGFRSLTGSK